MITREEAVEEARAVIAGNTKSNVGAARVLAHYVMQAEDVVAPFMERPVTTEASTCKVDGLSGTGHGACDGRGCKTCLPGRATSKDSRGLPGVPMTAEYQDGYRTGFRDGVRETGSAQSSAAKEPPSVGAHYFTLGGAKPCEKCGGAARVELSVGTTGFACGSGFAHTEACPTRFCEHGKPWSEDCPVCEAMHAEDEVEHDG